MTRLPIASPSSRVRASAASEDSSAGDHLDQLHHRRRVEEVHPHDALRALGGPRDRRDRDRRRVRRQHAVAGDDLARQRREQLVLELEALGRGLDDDVAVARASPSSPAACSSAASTVAALRRPALEPGDARALAALEPVRRPGRRRNVSRAGTERELRDAGAHRPGADDADDASRRDEGVDARSARGR